MDEHSGSNIVRQLRRADEALENVRPSAELDRRFEALLENGAPAASPTPRRYHVAAPAFALALGAFAFAIILTGRTDDGPATAGTVATAASTTPSPLAGPANAPAMQARAPEAELREPDTSASAVAETPRKPSLRRIRPPAPGIERIALTAAETRVLTVPLGRIEVRGPAVIDVTESSAQVRSGSARLLVAGSAPRALAVGETISWQMADPIIGDDVIQEHLARARAHSMRGEPQEALAALDALLEKNLSARVRDTVTLERASLLMKAGHTDEACALLAARPPAQDRQSDASALAAQWGCR